jgi:hypothetical protein
MTKIVSTAAAMALCAGLGACGGGPSFNNPFGNTQPPRPGQPVQPQQPLPVVTAPGGAGAKPSVLINASVKRVQDVIIERAISRNTNVVGANLTGVTLERALPSSPTVLEQSCGPHQQGRSVRIYLATNQITPTQTQVEEDRFVIDPGPRVCAVQMQQGDIEEATQALGGLKAQAERRPVAANAPRGLPPVPVR